MVERPSKCDARRPSMPPTSRQNRSDAAVLIGAVVALYVTGAPMCAAGLPQSAAPTGPPVPPIEQLRTYRYGPDASPLNAVAAWVDACRKTQTGRREAARQLVALLSTDASTEAKQYACRMLVLVASEQDAPALTRWLSDPALAHYALLALSRIPGPAVDALLRQQVRVATPSVRPAVVGALGERRSASAVPDLATLVASVPKGAAPSALALAAADSLGRIGDARGLAALRAARQRWPEPHRSAAAHALLVLGERLLRRGDREGARSAARAAEGTDAAPTVRAGALRLTVLASGSTATPLLAVALGEDGSLRQRAALGLVRDLPGPRVTAAVASRLRSLPSSAAKVLLLEALSDRGDPAACAAVLRCVSEPEPVRSAAIRALARVGDASAAPALVRAAASGSSDAQRSLAVLRGAAVNASLAAAVTKGPATERGAAIDALAARRATGALPSVLSAARAGDGVTRAAAMRYLGALGGHEHLAALLDALEATPADERGDAIAAVTEVARRDPRPERSVAAIAARVTGARAAQDRIDLLSILSDLGGPTSLKALCAALADGDNDVRLHALRLLTEWPDDAPMADLLRTVKSASDARQRTLALRGWVRMVGVNERRRPDEALSLYRQALALASNAAEKRVVLAGLAKLHSLQALDLAAQLAADPDLAAEAQATIVEIGLALSGAFPERVRALLAPIATSSEDETARNKASAALAVMDRFGDFVVAWEVSPAYQQEGADCLRLFDIPFAPEKPAEAGTVPWRPLPAGASAQEPWLMDLLALYGGTQKVAYIRTAVWSERERDLVLEMGSDDGAKIWWNGAVIFTDNTQHGVAPAQQRIPVRARAGWNHLMMKITQNVMGWGAVARFTEPGGAPAAGLRVALPSTLPANL